MATSNSDRERNLSFIGKSLRFLREGIAPFVEYEINKEGISKKDIIEKINTNIPERLKTLSDNPIAKWDESDLLPVMHLMWKEVFSKTLSRPSLSLVFESKDVRNHYSHPIYHEKLLLNENTYRALDTIRRLLEAISVPHSNEVKRLMQSLSSFNGEDHELPFPSGLPGPEEKDKPRPKERDKSEKIIGIDLGTMNSCVAIMERGEPRILEDFEEGFGSIIPSMVGFHKEADSEKDSALVGETARNIEFGNPQNVIRAIKRLIGRCFDDKEVQRHIKKVPYSIVRADNGDASVEILGERKSPQEISAHVLCKMKRIAMQHLDGPVRSAVITVPAYFNNSQRQATKDAGLIAGLDVKRIINEPTAAALNYVMDNWQDGSKIAFYDLGGGTFDISIIEMVTIDGKQRIDVKSINGDTFLGGIDFDDCIIKHIYAEMKKEHGVDLRSNKDPHALRITESEIKYEAEQAKKHLSIVEQTSITIRPFVGAQVLTMDLSRSKMESLVKHLIDRTIKPCRIAMKDAGVSACDIDEVILVGGQTRMPKVQEVVKSIFGKEPKWAVDPDKAVALGAAILGGILTDGDEKIFEDVTPQDVLPHSLGVRLKSGNMKKLIIKGTTIPAKESQIFSTAEDNQSAVTVHVRQGERVRADDNTSLGCFDLKGIPPAPRGVPKIEVTFDIDANGILNVSAIDKATGKEQSIQITDRSRLDPEEIERLRKKMIGKHGC